MATEARIENIAQYEGQEVTLKGWVYATTGKGKLQFLRLRDGSGIIQAVAFRPDLGDELFETIKGLGQESSVIVTGKVRADSRAPGVPGGFELGITSLTVVQNVREYPITPKDHGVEFLMDNRHLWLRSSQQWAIMRVRTTIKRAIMAFLDDQGFLNIDTPIITPAAAEGTSTLFEVAYYDDKAFLAQTGQLYNEANIMAFGKVYCFGPTFRAEKSKTRRHLSEFWMVEPEVAFCDLDQLMELEEQFVSHIVQTTLRERRAELAQSGVLRPWNVSPRHFRASAMTKPLPVSSPFVTLKPTPNGVRCWLLSGVTILVRLMKQNSPNSLTNLCLSMAILPLSKPFTWNRGLVARKCA